jgi:hypothetical protein
MNLSSKTLTFAANQISGNSVDGGVISNFASTGIDDNASSTAVTILSDGKVGIGTDSPSVKLHVDGAGSQPEIRVSQNSTYFTDYGVNHIDVNGPNDLRFLMGGAEKVRITSDGYIQANSQSQIRLTLGNVGTPGTNTANWIRGTGNSLGLNAASDNIHFEIGGNEKFKITASGGAVFNNVQDINQNFTVKSSGNAASIFIDGNGGHISVNRGNFSSNPTGSKLNVFGDGEVLRLDGTGGASRTLRFRGVSTVNPGIIIADGSLEITNEDANTSIALMSERDIIIKTTKSNSTAGHTKFYSHNTEIMRIDGQHNRVGIGTDGPEDKLHIRGINEPAHIRLQRHESDEALDNGDEIGGIEFWANDGTYNSNASTLRAAIRAETQNTSSGTRLEFWTGNSTSAVEERMRIIADGKVGIGTTSPSATLHVEDTVTGGGNSGHMKLGHTRTRTFYAGISSSENRWYKVLNYGTGNMFTGKVQIYLTREGGFNQTGAHKEYRASLGGYSNSVYGPLSLSGDGGEGGVASLEIGTDAGIYLRVNSSIYGGSVFVTFSGQGGMGWAYSNSSYSTSLP